MSSQISTTDAGCWCSAGTNVRSQSRKGSSASDIPISRAPTYQPDVTTHDLDTLRNPKEIMSEMLTPDGSSPDLHSPTYQYAKPQRVLACVLCQQRKVRCDRKFPCANCTKAGVQCTSAALLPRQRRRRFPERELLDRLRHYEDLLRRNHIQFEPLHSSATARQSDGTRIEGYRNGEQGVVDETSAETTTTYQAQSVSTI
jgi:ribosomal protein L13E